jgi:putative FmdB family regulatory protein
MPTYSYFCKNCECSFELFFHIKDYSEKPKCINCNCSRTERLYIADVLTQSASVKKSDSELKTLGDLAKRNSDRMSEDEKIHLYQKHNSYKYETPPKELPKGMSRVKKQPKITWPGSKHKIRRKPNNGR